MSRQSPDKSSRSPGGSQRTQQQQRQQNPTGDHNVAIRSKRNIEHKHRTSTFRSRLPFSYLRLTLFIILTVAIILTGIAFFSTNWLEVERRYYGSKFKRLGLWRMCFNSFSAPDDYQFKKFYVGCRWIFADEYKHIRKFLLPGWLTVYLLIFLPLLLSFLLKYITNEIHTNLSLLPLLPDTLLSINNSILYNHASSIHSRLPVASSRLHGYISSSTMFYNRTRRLCTKSPFGG